LAVVTEFTFLQSEWGCGMRPVLMSVGPNLNLPGQSSPMLEGEEGSNRAPWPTS